MTICASLRASSYNAALLSAAEAELTRLGHAVTRYADLDNVPHYNEDLDVDPPKVVADLRAALAGADGVLITTPTYNFTVPGALKDLIDWASRPRGESALIGKPVGIITASTGGGAGVASGEYVERVVSMLNASVVQPVTSVAKVTKVLTDGTPDDVTKARLVATAQALALAAQGAELVDNPVEGRYELRVGGSVAGFADYVVRANGTSTSVELPHTVTEPAFRGQGIASVLVRGALAKIAADGHEVIPTCPFVADFIAKQTNS